MKDKLLGWFLRKISTYTLQAVLSNRGYSCIKGDPWKWFESWLVAYEKANPQFTAKNVMDWINHQPMSAG